MNEKVPGSPSEGTTSHELPTACLVEGVAKLLHDEPQLEAVTLRPGEHSVQIATMGPRQEGEDRELKQRVSGMLTSLKQREDGRLCGLVTGKNDCGGCKHPSADLLRNQVKLTQTHEATTLARLSCPTAPMFWRWKSLPFPKLVAREVETPLSFTAACR